MSSLKRRQRSLIWDLVPEAEGRCAAQWRIFDLAHGPDAYATSVVLALGPADGEDGRGLAEGLVGAARVLDKALERDTVQHLDDGRGGVVHGLVQGAEVGAVALEAQRAAVDAVEVADDLDDFEEIDLVGGLRQHVAPAYAAPALDEVGASELLQYFGEVVGRDLGAVGEHRGRDELTGREGQARHRSQRVFSSL